MARVTTALTPTQTASHKCRNYPVK